jgi:phage-related protein
MKVKHYHTSSDRDVILAFLMTCTQQIRDDYFDAIALLEAGNILAMPLSRNLFSIHLGLHELRLKDAGGQFRFFYYIKKKTAIFVVHAFKKKKEELPPKEIELALRRIREV